MSPLWLCVLVTIRRRRRAKSGGPPHQALLHGDRAGGTERCLALWQTVARAVSPDVRVTPLIYENRVRGIRVVKCEQQANGE